MHSVVADQLEKCFMVLGWIPAVESCGSSQSSLPTGQDVCPRENNITLQQDAQILLSRQLEIPGISSLPYGTCNHLRQTVWLCAAVGDLCFTCYDTYLLKDFSKTMR
eukprot:scaffold3058_cov177-Amphora_coffeaeformis.AAC.11